VRPVIVAPSASGAYLFPFLVQRPLDVGGLLAINMVSMWGETTAGAYTRRRQSLT
jgi:hypothetical protein